jgi:hypothetical protein
MTEKDKEPVTNNFFGKDMTEDEYWKESERLNQEIELESLSGGDRTDHDPTKSTPNAEAANSQLVTLSDPWQARSFQDAVKGSGEKPPWVIGTCCSRTAQLSYPRSRTQ